MRFYHVSFVVMTCISFFFFLLCVSSPRPSCPVLSPFSVVPFVDLPSFVLICSLYLHSLFSFSSLLLLSCPPLSFFSFPPLSLPPLPFPSPPLSSPQACEIPETAVFSLAPSEELSLAKPCSVPYWDLLQTSVQGKVELPLPLKHMLFSLSPRPEGAVTPWSLPAPIRPDFPRQSLSLPGDPDSVGGLSSRWVKQSMCGLLAVTVHLE